MYVVDLPQSIGFGYYREVEVFFRSKQDQGLHQAPNAEDDWFPFLEQTWFLDPKFLSGGAGSLVRYKSTHR